MEKNDEHDEHIPARYLGCRRDRARIDDTGYKVMHLAAEHYHHGWTAEELLRQHPDLRPEQVYSALAYFYDHHASLFSQLKASFEAAEIGRPSQAVLRDELLRCKFAAET